MTDKLDMALALVERKKFDRAEIVCRQHLQAEPDDGFGHAVLALCLAGRGNLTAAETAAARAVALEPDEAYVHYVLSVVLYERNDLARSLDSANESIRLDPHGADVHAHVAEILVKQKQWQQALEAADRALQLEPAHIGAANSRAIALRLLGREDDQLSTLEAALARDPDNDVTHVNIGYARLLRGDREKALYHFREALRLDPDDPLARDALSAVWRNALPPFRWATRFSLWLARIGFRGRLVAGLAIGVVVWLSLSALFEAPALAQHFDLLILAVHVVLLLLLFADELANAVLMLHPLGRREMRPRVRAAALCAAAWALLGIAALAVCLIQGDADARYVISTIGQQALTFAMPQLALFCVPTGRPTVIMAVGVAICGLLVSADIAYGFLGSSADVYWAGWYAALTACLLVFMLGGVLRHVQVKR